jgi:putative FmdB family regulatory protein
MPTYEYACSACGNGWEAEQRITADPLECCPKCGRKTAKRQISSGGTFILKGGGWYSDLYSSKKTSTNESKTEVKPLTSETKAKAPDPPSPTPPKGSNDVKAA